MAKKKKKENPKVVVGDGTKPIVRKREEILDISAGEMILDVNAKDEEEKTIEGRLRANHIPTNTTVFYMRMGEDLLKRVKQVARERSFKEEVDIPYQKIINEAVAEKYPVSKEK